MRAALLGRLPALPPLGGAVSAPATPEPQPCPGCGRANTARPVVGVRLCWCCVSRRSAASEVVSLLNFASGRVLNVKVGLN